MITSIFPSRSECRKAPASINALAMATAGKYEPQDSASHKNMRFCSELNRAQMSTISLSDKIVSFCLFQKGMTGVEGRSPASRRRHPTTDRTSRKPRRQTLCRRAA